MQIISDINTKNILPKLNCGLFICAYSVNYLNYSDTFFQKLRYLYIEETKLIPTYEIYVTKITKSYITKFNKKDSLTDLKFPKSALRLKSNYTNTKFI